MLCFAPAHDVITQAPQSKGSHEALGGDVSATLRFDNIGKVFPGVRALDGVSFDVNAGEVHGLMGENGAGKSTLLKILGGEYQPDSGRVMIDGNEVRFSSAASSIAAGNAVGYPGQ